MFKAPVLCTDSFLHTLSLSYNCDAWRGAQTGVLEYPKEDSVTTMARVKRFLQRKDGAAPGTPPKLPPSSTPKQKRVRG